MIYLNFTHLDEGTQRYLLSLSRSDIETKYGDQLKQYAKENDIDYESLLEKEALRNLYTYKYKFTI